MNGLSSDFIVVDLVMMEESECRLVDDAMQSIDVGAGRCDFDGPRPSDSGSWWIILHPAQSKS